MSDWSADVCSSDLRFSCVGRLSSLPDPPARRGSKEIPTMPVPVLVALCYLVGLGIVYPFLPFQALSLGATPLQVSLLLVTDTAVILVLAPYWGRLSDQVGRRRVIALALAPASTLPESFSR